MKIVAIDTNVLLSYRLQRQPSFDQANQLIIDCLNQKVTIFIPSIVFPELEWVLRSYYKQTKTPIIKFLDDLLNIEGIIIDNDFQIQKALNIFKEANITFTDSLLLAQIQETKPDEFLTFDQDLEKLYLQSFS